MSRAGGITAAAGPHVFVDDLDDAVPSETDAHHLVRSLRIRVGDELTVSDGRGAWRAARWRDGGPVEPVGAIVREPRPTPVLTIGFALVKGARPELVVQKATELGMDRIVPFIAERSVVRWDDARSERHGERLERVAREAAMQCRRCWLPTVEALGAFADLVAVPGAAIADLDAEPLRSTTTTLLIGPEGGWSPAERAAAPARVGLSAHVLRAETAAIAAATLLGANRSGFVGPPGAVGES